MNSVAFIGNLTRDIELRHVGENKTALTTLGVAINNNRGKNEETVFVDVDVWGVMAENCVKYLAKGRQVGVTGRLKQETWEDKETKKKRSKILIVADSVQFIGGKTLGANQDEPTLEQPVEVPVESGDTPEVPF